MMCSYPYVVVLLLLACMFVAPAEADDFFTITLKTDAAARYIAATNMGPVEAAQTFGFALSMGTPYISVVGTNCTTCNNSPAYNPALSTTVEPLSGSANFTLIGGGSTAGTFISENCRLPTDNGSIWSYPNQTIVVAANSTDLFNNQVSGIIGLQTGPAQSALFNASVIGSIFDRNPAKPSLTYGMALQPPSVGSSNAGELHWLGADTSAFQAPATVLNTTFISSAVSTSAGAGSPTTVFDLDGWDVSISGASAVQSLNTGLQAALDPYLPAIYFPATQATLIHNSINGSSASSGDNSQSTVWAIPCGTQFSLSSTIGGTSFALDQSQLIQKNSDGTCSSYIRGWTDATVEVYLFGSSFISSLYLIVKVANPSSGQPNQIWLAPRAVNSSSTPVGAIVGGVVGGFAVLVLVGIGIFFIVRHNRRSKTPGVETNVSEPKIEPYNYPPEIQSSRGSYQPYNTGNMPYSTTSTNAALLHPRYSQPYHGDAAMY